MSNYQQKAVESAVISNYFRDQLFEITRELFETFPIGRISKMLSELSFYAVNPDYSKDLDVDGLKNLLTEPIQFMEQMSLLCENFNYCGHE